MTPTPLRALTVAAALAAPAPSLAQDRWTNPFPGVRRLHRTTSTQNINALFVDLCAAGVSVRVTAASERARTVPSFGALVGAQAAVNGGFYNTRDLSMTDGYVLHAGASWGGTDHRYTGPIAFGDSRVELLPHEAVMGPASWMREAVEGHPTLVHDGALRDNAGDTGLCPRNPRTAAGLTADRRTLLLVVVDGRRTPTRSGMTCNELAALMRDLGARWALNLDGGGSSTMWLSGTGVLNYPSDGTPRTVSNHLAVYARGSGAAPHCPPPRFRAVYVMQTFPLARTTLDLGPGETFRGYLEMRNTGTETWTPARTRLGTTQPRDRASPLAGPGWLAPNRPAAIDRTVAPGATGRFNFTVRAPTAVGEVSQYFNLLEEGVAWFSDPGQGGPADNVIQIRVRTVPRPMDAGTPVDAGPRDAGTDRGAAPDTVAPPVDAALDAPEDVPAVDTGEDVEPADTGAEDVPEAVDTGAEDAPTVEDAPVTTADVVTADAGDAGVVDEVPEDMPAGCTCATHHAATTRGGIGAALAAVVGALAARRRRRRG